MAASAEHFMRIPVVIVDFSKKIYQMQDFIDWLEVNEPDWKTVKHSPGVVVSGQDIMSHPAIQALLDGVEKGRRNSTCFTLALAMKSASYAQEQALTELLAWNFRNRPQLPISNIRACVRSAYSGKYRGPSARKIRELSGMEFHHRICRRSDGEKKRSEYVPMRATWSRILAWLMDQGGQVVTQQSQAQIAANLGVKYRSLCQALSDLRDANAITIETTRKGRGRAETTYALVCSENDEKEPAMVFVPAGADIPAETQYDSKIVDLAAWKESRSQQQGELDRGG